MNAGSLSEKEGCVLCIDSYIRLSERTLARSFVSSFPPLTVSMTRVHHASPDSLNWVRHFRWLDPSKSLAATSLQPPPPLGLPKVRESSEGLPTYPDPIRGLRTRAEWLLFSPPEEPPFWIYDTKRVYGARTPKNFGR